VESDELNREKPESSPMWQLLEEEEYDFRTLQRGDIRRGTIISIDPEHIIVDIGAKREGIVPRTDLERLNKEFRAQLKVGDEVPVYIMRPESPEGEVIVSINMARTQQDWSRARELLESGEIVELTVSGHNKGGLIVNFGQLQGFVPRSHLVNLGGRTSSGAPQDRLAQMVGQKIALRVVEVSRRQRRLILSERAAWREWRKVQKDRLLAEIQEGEIRKGQVTTISDFGVFVDLGGADGLIHISELSWDRNTQAKDLLEVGQEVEVYVMNVDRERKRIGLSLKRLKPDPWTLVEQKYQVNEIVTGTVTNITKFGAFARLEEGIEGLIHVSELADYNVNKPDEVVQEGQTYHLRILNIDPNRRRIGLSLRQVPQAEQLTPETPLPSEEDPLLEAGSLSSEAESEQDVMHSQAVMAGSVPASLT